MIKIVRECVGCPPEMGCNKQTCSYWNSVRFYCDRCGKEETLYHYDGQELCIDCITDDLEEVVGSDY
jgi:hypothetical protein